MKKIALFLLLFPFISHFGTSNSEIIDSTTIEVAREYMQDVDLVVFDIDNTIMEAEYPEEANCQWCDWVQEQLRAKGYSKAEAFQKMIRGYLIFNEQAKVRAVEDSTVDFIVAIQQKGIPVIAITGRPDSMEQVTVRNLAYIGVDFSKMFPNTDIRLTNGTHFIKGIIYNNEQGDPEKGASLKLFLNELGINHKKIVMIDDRKHCLESVQQHLPDVTVIGIRYGRCDERFQNFVYTDKMREFGDNL